MSVSEHLSAACPHPPPGDWGVCTLCMKLWKTKPTHEFSPNYLETLTTIIETHFYSILLYYVNRCEFKNLYVAEIIDRGETISRSNIVLIYEH